MSCSENRQSRHKIIFSSSVYRYPQNAGRVAIVCVTQNRPFLNHADELGLGIKCTPEGRIINEQDNIEEGIWCIGPMRKAVLWETTALRELREQASELASLISEKQ